MIDASVLRALAAAGASAEMIVAAVEAAQSAEAEKVAARRAKDAERKRKSRMSQDVRVTSRDGDGHDVTGRGCSPSPSPQRDISNPPSTPPQSSLRSVSGSASAESEFSDFWDEWPNRVGKPAAQRAFVAARRRAPLAKIIAGVRAYVAAKPSDRPWLNPATFLNQDRFDDVPAPVSLPNPRAAPAPRDAQEFRNPMLKAAKKLEERYAAESQRFEPDTGFFAADANPGQRSTASGNSTDETGAPTRGLGPVLDLAAYR